MNKPHSILCCILLACASPALAADPVQEQLAQQSQAQIRDTLHAPGEGEYEQQLERLMQQEQFSQATRAQVRQILADAESENLPVEPFLDKVHEGIAKHVDQATLVEALDRVQHRYRYAYEKASEQTTDARLRKRLGDTIAAADAAGLKKEDCDAVMTALRTRTRTMTQDQSQELALETFATARIMSHSRVRSSMVSEVLVSALDKSYETEDMNTMQSAFRARARYGNPDEVAKMFSQNIQGGMTAGQLELQARQESKNQSRSASGNTGKSDGGQRNSSGNSNQSGGNSSGGSTDSGSSSGGGSKGGSDNGKGGSGSSGGSGTGGSGGGKGGR